MTNSGTSKLFGSNNVLQIYKSGFLGAPVNQFRSKEPVAKLESVNGIMHQLTVLANESNLLKVNPHVDQVYDALITQGANLTRFQFLDDALTTFLEASQFPGSFFEWVLQQTNSPCLTRTHIDFMADALGFAFTGKRKLSLNSWSHILKHANQQMIEGEYRAQAAELARQFGHTRQINWTELVSLWLGQENGLRDLVQTMWIIYGSGIPSK